MSSKQLNVGDPIRFMGTGRGSHKVFEGTVGFVIDHREGRYLMNADRFLAKFKPGNIKFDPKIPGRNHPARHYLVVSEGCLYRPSVTRILGDSGYTPDPPESARFFKASAHVGGSTYCILMQLTETEVSSWGLPATLDLAFERIRDRHGILAIRSDASVSLVLADSPFFPAQ